MPKINQQYTKIDDTKFSEVVPEKVITVDFDELVRKSDGLQSMIMNQTAALARMQDELDTVNAKIADVRTATGVKTTQELQLEILPPLEVI